MKRPSTWPDGIQSVMPDFQTQSVLGLRLPLSARALSEAQLTGPMRSPASVKFHSGVPSSCMPIPYPEIRPAVNTGLPGSYDFFTMGGVRLAGNNSRQSMQWVPSHPRAVQCDLP